jgi:hypothetical protein
MRNRRHQLGGLYALTLCALTACGGGDAAAGGSGGGAGGSQETLRTGLPPERLLSSFNDADARQACQSLSDGAARVIPAEELVRAECATHAIEDTAVLNDEQTAITINIADCEALATACQANPESVNIYASNGVADEDCSGAVAGVNIQRCDATVAEYESCVSALLYSAKETLAGLSCANARMYIESESQADLDAQDLPACRSFLSKCQHVELNVLAEP